MAVNTYEGMFLLDTNIASTNWDDVVKQVHGILEQNQAEVVASRQWDERRLAYPVNGHKKGTYLLTYFRVEGAKLQQIEHACRHNGVILRDLVLKVPPKLAEHMIRMAMTAGPSGEQPEEESRDEDGDQPRHRRGHNRDRQ